MSICGFRRGSIATLYANFTELSGMSVDPPAPKMSVYYKDTLILSPVTMLKAKDGLYYYDWDIPATTTLGQYAVLFEAVIDGIEVQGENDVFILPASIDNSVGSGGGEMLNLPECDVTEISSRMSDLIGAVFYFIEEAQTIPIYDEQAVILESETVARGTFKMWNNLAFRSPIVRKNGEQITSGYSVNFVRGYLDFDKPLLETDTIELDYNFRCFDDCALAQYISASLQDINIVAPATSYTIENLPAVWESTVIYGAVAHALRRLVFKLNFQEKAIIFGGRDSISEIISNFSALLTQYKEKFEDQKTLVKRGRWPTPYGVVVPEYTMPGGRSRWFRYLYK
jgi:hypothetical protein